MAEKVKVLQQAAPDDKQPQKLSGIGYPYNDFNDSLKVAEIIHLKGGGSCDIDQLAAWLDYKSTSSGTFASRLSSARYFGLIGNTKSGRVGITDRARAIIAPVMPDDAVKGRADAFLGVGLYKQIFDHFRGTTLPPDVGLQNLFQQQYKILPDRVQQAVRVFKDSATQTGFFLSARDRLIRPAATALSPAAAQADAAPEAKRDEVPPERRRTIGGGGGGGDDSGVDPSILGLLRRLPQPGAAWTKADQQAFLEAFAGVVKFMYPAKGEADGA